MKIAGAVAPWNITVFLFRYGPSESGPLSFIPFIRLYFIYQVHGFWNIYFRLFLFLSIPPYDWHVIIDSLCKQNLVQVDNPIMESRRTGG